MSMPRARTWPAALLVAVVFVLAGCSTPDPAPPVEDGDGPVAEEPAAGVDPEPAPLGTSADELDGAVVLLAPSADEVASVDASTLSPGDAGPDRDAGVSRVDVRVAADDAARRQGLMAVEELPDSTGMLFVFDTERTGGFWMQDTLVPLDIAFAGGDGTIRAILTMPPCGDADPCPIYDPEIAYALALEVPAGWFAARDIEVGDHLHVGPIESLG